MRCHPGQIPLGILLASEQVVADVLDVLFLGELSPDGGLRRFQGVLPMVRLARVNGQEHANHARGLCSRRPQSGAGL